MQLKSTKKTGLCSERKPLCLETHLRKKSCAREGIALPKAGIGIQPEPLKGLLETEGMKKIHALDVQAIAQRT